MILEGVVMRYKHIMLSLGISLPVCVLLRTFQLLFMIEGKTGFVGRNYTYLSAAIMIIIFAAAALNTIFGATVHRSPKRMPKVNIALGISAMILGCAIIYDSINSIVEMPVTSWQNFVMVVMGCVCAIWFMAYGAKAVYNYKLPHLTYVIPVIYWAAKFIVVFTSISPLTLITDNVFVLISYCAVLIFMFEFAKVANNIDKDTTYKKLLSSGIASTILCAVSSLPRLIATGAGTIESLHDSVSSVFVSLVTGIFVLVYCLSHFSNSNLSYKKNKRPINLDILPIEGHSDSFYTGNK